MSLYVILSSPLLEEVMIIGCMGTTTEIQFKIFLVEM